MDEPGAAGVCKVVPRREVLPRGTSRGRRDGAGGNSRRQQAKAPSARLVPRV